MNPPLPASAIRYVAIPCEFCRGTPGRQYTTTVGGTEWSEMCRWCNGKGTIVVEREAA